MQKKLKSAAFPLLSIIIGLSFSSLASIAQEAEPTDFNPGDFSGDWDRVTSIVTYSNVPGSSRAPNNRPMEDVGPVAEAPFTAEGLALIEANDPGYGPRRQMVRNDPLGRCEPMGIPRNLTAEVLVPHNTLEIVQLPDRIIQFFEYRHDWREIWMDGRELPDLDIYDFKWNGYSIGHMDGDTLVVESVGFDDRSWLDKYGYPHSDQMHLIERYRRIDADTLELTMTLTDPVVYTEPWESDVKIYNLNREKRAGWDEQIYCVPAEEMLFQDLMDTGNVIQ